MRFYPDFDLTNYNSYRIHSACKNAFFPENEDEVFQIFKGEKNFIVLGSGHNVILSKEYYDKSFIIFNGNFNHVLFEGDIAEAESGILMLDLCNQALEKALSGIEVFYDIPSSLGGAVLMNAGAGGEEIKDVILKVRYLDLDDMKIKEIHQHEIRFEYRNSFFQQTNKNIILKAWLQLHEKNKEEISLKMETIKSQRWAKQPKELPNAGSVFKRPEGKFVGQMIEELGLKGFSVGGAMVSVMHAGFIVNSANATGNDVLTLIKIIQEKVKDKFGIDLILEQRII